MALISIVFVAYAGILPMASYTLTSWNLLSLRLLLAWAAEGSSSLLLRQAALVIRFPALVGNAVTVIVWWTVLVPVIWVLIGDAAKRRGFLLFNIKPFLLLVHLWNLPMALVDFVASGQEFYMFDLWCGFAVVVAYMVFYLNYLDRHGLHFYIVFTPRTPWCVVTYSAVLVIYKLVFDAANQFLISSI